MADNEIKTIIKAVLDDKGFKASVQGMTNTMKDSTTSMAKSWQGFAIGINQGIELISKGWNAFKKVFDFAKEFSQYKSGMDALARNTGQNADTIIEKLREVSKGTISNKDLMLTTNRAIALGVTDDVNVIAKLLEIARVKSQAMGTSVSEAFNSLALGIGRASPMILDNLGIVTKGWDAEAKAKGVSYDRQFILNKILKQGGEELSRVGKYTDTTVDKMARFQATLDNFKLKLGEALAPIADITLDGLNKLFDFYDKTVKMITKTVWNLETLQMKIGRIMATPFLSRDAIERMKLLEVQRDITIAKWELGEMKIQDATKKTTSTVVGELEKIRVSMEDYYSYLSGKAGEEIDNENKKYEQLLAFAEQNNLNKEMLYQQHLINLQLMGDAYYQYMDMQRELDEVKERERYLRALAYAQKNNLDIEVVEKQHALNMLTIESGLLKSISDAWRGASESIAKSYADGLAKAIVSGEIFHKSFSDFLKDLISMWIEMIAQAVAYKAILAGLNFITGGITGFLGGLLGLNKGGVVPQYLSDGGKLAYAASGFTPQGSDTVPAMLTPGERVLSVAQNEAFENMMKQIAFPAGAIPSVSNETVNNNNSQNMNAQNTFYVEGLTVDELLNHAQRTNSRLFRR